MRTKWLRTLSDRRQRSRAGHPSPYGRDLRRGLVGLAALVATGCTAVTAIPAQEPSVTTSRLSVDTAGLRAAPGLDLLAAYRLRSSDPRFGGFSAIETDGATLWLLSDRATLWQASLDLDARTDELGLRGWRVGALVGDAADRRPLDGEALALASDGALLAAFEHDDSLRRLRPGPDGDWHTERLHPGRLIEGAPPNEGLEALASWPDGTLLALSEGARSAPGIARGARLAGGAVEPFGYRTGEGFSPVAADAAGGRLYVLERAVGVLTGWQSRLTRTPIPSMPIGSTLEGEEVLRINAGDLAENYEGMAILERAGERDLILLVSDDNFSVLQRTLLLVSLIAG